MIIKICETHQNFKFFNGNNVMITFAFLLIERLPLKRRAEDVFSSLSDDDDNDRNLPSSSKENQKPDDTDLPSIGTKSPSFKALCFKFDQQ